RRARPGAGQAGRAAPQAAASAGSARGWTAPCAPADGCRHGCPRRSTRSCGLLPVTGDQLARRQRLVPFPALQVATQFDHVDAVHRAGLDAEVAAGAFGDDHGVHLLGGADGGSHRAGLHALGAAAALGLADIGDARRYFAFRGVQRLGLDIQQSGQRLDGGLAARWALVDLVAAGDGFGVGLAARITALAALGLRQQGVDLLGDRIAFDPEAYRRETQDRAAHQAQRQQREYGNQNQAHSLINPVKPMNASDIRPAVTMPMAAPWNERGSSAMAMRSRMAANSTSTREKPRPAAKPLAVAVRKVNSDLLALSRATPSTMQLVVISGRKIPSTRYSRGLVLFTTISVNCTTTAITRMKLMVRRNSRSSGFNTYCCSR